MNTIAIIILAAVCVASAQRNVDSRNAAILAEARYLSGDGSFGAAYVQEDGTNFKEETLQNGDRKGQYSYIDPNGKTITVHYTAGKNGFQVSGDHLPKAPAPLPVAPVHQPRAPAVPQYNAAPQYNSIPQHQPRQQAPASSGSDDDGQYRPEIHEHPYAYRDDGSQYQQSQYQPAPQQQAPAQQFNQGFNYQHQGFANNYQQPIQTTTQQPTRFFPPGKLDLNRTPDGFNYQFQSRQ